MAEQNLECSPLPIYRSNERPTTSSDCSKDAAARKLYEELAPATAEINVGSKSGSGFFVGDGSRVVTNAHVAAGEHELFDVIAKDGQKYKARIERLDDINDLAVLRLEKNAHHPRSVQITSSNSLKPGDRVYAIGHPGGRDETYISPGVFNNRYHLGHIGSLIPEKSGLEGSFKKASEEFGEKSKKDGEAYLRSERLQKLLAGEPGSSGSGVFNHSGQLVGVLTNGPPGKTMKDNCWSVPSDAVLKLLNDDAKFTFKYENHSLIRHHPIFVGTVSTGLSALALGLPRVGGTVTTLLAGFSLPADLKKLQGDTSLERTKGYLGVATDVALISGHALSFFSKTKALGYTGLAIGLAGVVGQSFVPEHPYLVEIQRSDGDKRTPFWWNK